MVSIVSVFLFIVPILFLLYLYFCAENVIGEAEWKTESRKCEGIIIDKYFPDLGPANLDSIENSEISIEKILYDGVVPDYENTFHGNLNTFYAKNLKSNVIESQNSTEIIIPENIENNKNISNNTNDNKNNHENNNENNMNNIVLPDTIVRQIILHEIHAEGMGPDWDYADSLNLLLGTNKYLKIIYIYDTCIFKRYN